MISLEVIDTLQGSALTLSRISFEKDVKLRNDAAKI